MLSRQHNTRAMASGGVSGVSITKRKRLSKNKKKSWRKTDVRDVEEFLEEERLEERTGYVYHKR